MLLSPEKDMDDFRLRNEVRAQGLMLDPARWALFLDIDGTLIDVAPTPDAAHAPAGLVHTLQTVARRFSGGLALSTGRRIADADRLFAPFRPAASGVHGTEMRTTPGGEVTMVVPPVPAELMQAVADVARIAPGILLEHKGAGAAIHFRSVPWVRPDLQAQLERLLDRWPGLELRAGAKVLEILPAGHSKGTALVALMRQAPFRGRLPIIIGDDTGDESALSVARRLGGVGLTVAGERFSMASADFENPAGVRAWLALLAGNQASGATST